MTSADGGKTWKVGGGDMRKAAGKYAIHPAVVQRGDGNFLAFLRGPNPMPAFVSKDEGETWEPVSTPFPGISVGQKAAALKLASGASCSSASTTRNNSASAAHSRRFCTTTARPGRTFARSKALVGTCPWPRRRTASSTTLGPAAPSSAAWRIMRHGSRKASRCRCLKRSGQVASPTRKLGPTFRLRFVPRFQRHHCFVRLRLGLHCCKALSRLPAHQSPNQGTPHDPLHPSNHRFRPARSLSRPRLRPAKALQDSFCQPRGADHLGLRL